MSEVDYLLDKMYRRARLVDVEAMLSDNRQEPDGRFCSGLGCNAEPVTYEVRGDNMVWGYCRDCWNSLEGDREKENMEGLVSLVEALGDY